MELENRTMKMLLQSMPKKGFVLTFVVFIVLFTVCVIIGVTGPFVYDLRTVSAYRCPADVSTFQADVCEGIDMSKPTSNKWSGEIQNLDKLNQELRLIATLENKNYTTTGITKELEFVVDIAGKNTIDEQWKPLTSAKKHKRSVSCAENIRWCANITLAHELFIEYAMYQFNVTIIDSGPFLGDVAFTFKFVNHNYTLFELWFRFAFLILSFVVVIIYAHKLRSFNWKDWAMEQKWIVILLFGLMAYDNPFYPMEILVQGWFPIFLNRVLYASFLVLILFFWLIMFDGLRKDALERGLLVIYLPKVILLGLFWIVGVVLFTWSQLYELSDPTYNTPSEFPGFIFFQVFEFLILIVYIFWLLYVVCRACSDAKTIPYLGVRIKFFGVFTLLVIFTVIGGVIFGVIGHISNNAAEFISFLALFNLYVWTLAFMYLPAGGVLGSGPSQKHGMVRLEDEDDVSFGSLEEPKQEENEMELEDKK